jgi:hypothetical protein
MFGLGPAGQALGSLMRPILTFLTLRGIRNIMYVDNGRTAAATKEKADSDYAFMLDTFKKAGFTVAKNKSDAVGESARRNKYLGFIIDSTDMSVVIPDLKMLKVWQGFEVFLRLSTHKVRDAASMIGKLIALEAALGRLVLIGTRLTTATETSTLVRVRELNDFISRKPLASGAA